MLLLTAPPPQPVIDPAEVAQLSGADFTGAVSMPELSIVELQATTAQADSLSSSSLQADALSSGSLQIVDQTSDGKVFNFCARGGVIEAGMGKYKVDSGTAIGACVGALGYCCLSVWNDEETKKTHIKLSGDISNLEAVYKNSDAEWTWAFLSWNCSPVKIETTYHVDGETSAAYVVASEQLVPDNQVGMLPKTEEDYVALWTNATIDEDDNILYSARYPDAGNQVVPFFYGSHIEGCKTKAIQRCTHAEGRRTIADGRYSHAEGSDNLTGGASSHAEGMSNKVYSSYGHVEGGNNYVTSKSTASHCEGWYNKVDNYAAHVGGYSSEANGVCSFAHGFYAYADTDYSIALGQSAVADGKNCFVWSGNSGPVGRSRAYMNGKKIDGCFAVNPKNGANGFYIGEQTLSAIISSAVEAALKAKGL